MYHLDKSLVVVASCMCPAPLWPHGFLPTLQPEDPCSATINVGLVLLGFPGGRCSHMGASFEWWPFASIQRRGGQKYHGSQTPPPL